MKAENDQYDSPDVSATLFMSCLVHIPSFIIMNNRLYQSQLRNDDRVVVKNICLGYSQYHEKTRKKREEHFIRAFYSVRF